MPKMKSKRAARKRFKRTGSGKWLRFKANRSHLNAKKPAKRKRRLRRTAILGPADHGRMARLLPYR